MPVILAGASYGRLIGKLLGSISSLEVGLFSLLGAASFLGGTMRMTVTLCVILLELTNDLIMLPLMMLVLVISKTVEDSFNKGVYDQIVKMKGLHHMEAHTEPYMRHLTDGDVCSGPLITFSGIEKVGDILHALQMAAILGGTRTVRTRSEVSLVLLKGKNSRRRGFYLDQNFLRIFHGFDFVKPGSERGLCWRIWTSVRRKWR